VRGLKTPQLSLQQFAGLGLLIALVAGLVPAFLTFAPASHWDQPLVLGVLALLAIVAIKHDLPLRNGAQFDATAALALIAVALAGPLPALAVILPPIAVHAFTGGDRLLRLGTLSNVAAYGWYTLTGAFLLELVPVDVAWPVVAVGLVVAGMAQLLVSWLIGPAIFGALYLGHPLRAYVQMLRGVLPAGAVMAALGAVTVVLFPVYGVLALGVFALIAVLPQSALTYAAQTRPAGSMDLLTATQRYAAALSVQLRLDRNASGEVDAVVRLAHERGYADDPLAHMHFATVDPSERSCAAGHVTEWWNGAGGPAGVPGTLIPLSARIVAVAQTWAALTAAGGPQIGHADAVEHLESGAGVRFDPRVVRAVRVVVRQERVTAEVPAPEPRMHHLGVPAPLRRAIAAASA